MYSLGVGVLIQLVLLPYVFPGWHAGHGLLKGGDWVFFHDVAAELAQQIHASGWSAWKMRPSDSPNSGMLGAIYFFTGPHPWVLLPLNAALHALSGVLIFMIAQSVLRNRRLALLSALPFIFFPSALTWVSQIHKDGFAIAGSFLFLYAWILLCQLNLGERGREAYAKVVYCILGCLVLVLWMRPYLLKSYQPLGLFFAAWLTVVGLRQVAKQKMKLPGALVPIAAAWLTAFFIIFVARVESKGLFGGASEAPNGTMESAAKAAIAHIDKSKFWVRSLYLPDVLEMRICTIAEIREGYRMTSINAHAKSAVDLDLILHSAKDFLFYLPRALELAYFSPFPYQWVGKSDLESNTAFRKISGLEMVGLYLAFPFWLWILWRLRRNNLLWLCVIFCGSHLLLFSYTFPNIGTLYRMRYGFIMLLGGFGLSGLTVWVATQARRWKKRSSGLHPAKLGT